MPCRWTTAGGSWFATTATARIVARFAGQQTTARDAGVVVAVRWAGAARVRRARRAHRFATRRAAGVTVTSAFSCAPATATLTSAWWGCAVGLWFTTASIAATARTRSASRTTGFWCAGGFIAAAAASTAGFVAATIAFFVQATRGAFRAAWAVMLLVVEFVTAEFW